jgi:1-phosphofructokinase
MIYTVTFNPAIDYSLIMDNFCEGITNRSKEEEICFGGKGINVSYVLGELGLESTALGFVAGFTGEYLISQLEENAVKTDFIKLKDGFTRINVKLKGKIETEINAVGPEISTEAVNLLLEKLDKLTEGDTLVLAGSIPKTISNNIYEQILFRHRPRHNGCHRDAF